MRRFAQRVGLARGAEGAAGVGGAALQMRDHPRDGGRADLGAPGRVEIYPAPGLVERLELRADGVDWKSHVRRIEGSANMQKRT